jgi:tetratricopeptide (TPR) repeat protein
MGPWLKGGRQFEASQEITTDIANIHAAWHSAVQHGDRQAILRAAEPYWLYHEFRGLLAQGEASFREAAEAITDEASDPVLAGFLWAAHGSLLSRQWQFDQGRERMEHGIQLLRQAEPPDPEKTAFALAWFAFMHVITGQYEQAARSAEESLGSSPKPATAGLRPARCACWGLRPYTRDSSSARRNIFTSAWRSAGRSVSCASARMPHPTWV